MNKPLSELANNLESEIKKIHNMVIDLPEELFIKDHMIKNTKKHWCSRTMGNTDEYFQSKFGEKLDGGYRQQM